MTVPAGAASAAPGAPARRRLSPPATDRVPRGPIVALVAVIAAVTAPYLLAIVGPLRLQPDSVVYLALARGIPLPPGHQEYPFGYPALLRGVGDVGLGSSWGLVTVNVLLVVIALVVVYRLCRDPFHLSSLRAALVCIALLLSHTLSDLSPSPLSDIPYLTFAMVCMLALTRAERRTGRSRLALVLLGGILAAAAIAIRTQGVALVPPVLFVALGLPNLRRGWRLIGKHRVISIVAAPLLIAGGIVAAVLVISATTYAHNLAYVWRDINGVGSFLARLNDEVRTKLMSLGELAGQTNCCHRLSPSFGPLLEAGGALVLALVGLGWRTRPRLGAIEVFVLSTAFVILVYAGAAPRFWLAALPFMIVYLLFAGERLARIRGAKAALGAFLVFFSVAGAGWLVDSMILSTAGRRFPDLWSGQVPELAATYRVAFGEARPGDPRKVHTAALEELRRYEPLARH